MLGKIDVFFSSVLVLCTLALLTDLWKRRIFNWLTFSGILLGLSLSGWFHGWEGLTSSLWGAGAGFLLLGWMFFAGLVGGGDVKLLIALGSLGGGRYVLHVLLLSVLLGGVQALGILTVKRKLPGFVRRMREFLVSLFIKELAVQKPRLDHSEKMPFGVAIAVAGIWVACADPFVNWSILP